MKYGFIAVAGSPPEMVELAAETEAHGWDGFFTFDGGSFDPWSLLAAAAMRTERVTLGAMLFPLSRRRPWNVVNQATTVDHLSNGRLVIPVGLGAIDTDLYAKVHPEATDRRERAERLDEALEIMVRAWTGEPFSFQGKHYQVDDLQVQPRPVQQPRIPVWAVGAWPHERSLARAAHWDGIIPSDTTNLDPDEPITAARVREIRDWMSAHREAAAPFDIVLEGVTDGDDPAATRKRIAPLAAAGATWWIESRWIEGETPESLRRRIRQGPPKL
jgi:alkanesulfonate monooxygenase SsuD/methylene tetrahydromethanopterin reductase-like flavin-dependent oxidoreductase (luciferase family)